MNDEEEVVETQGEGQEQEQASESGSSQRRPTAKESFDQVKDSVSDVGKTVENFGKGEQKVADWMDGGEKAGNAATTAANTATTAAEKGTEAAKKAAEVKEKGAEAAEKAAKASKEAAKAGKTAAQTGKAASTATSAAADAEKAGSQAAAAAGPVGGVVSAVGQTAAGIQKGVAETGKAASTVAEAGATAAEAGAATAEATAAAAKNEAKAEKAALNAADAAAKSAKTGTGAAKKASDKSLADKLREHGKLNQMRGKRIQEAADKFDSDKVVDKYTDKLGKAGKAVGGLLKGILKSFDPKTIAVVSLIFIIVSSLFVSYILSPMFFMQVVKDNAFDPDRIEKVKNFLNGLGYKDSYEAFYDEVDYLNTHYHEELDFPYIMATLYYVEIYYGKQNAFYFDDNSKICGSTGGEKCDAMQLGYRLAEHYFVQEATSQVGPDGLIYSSNKLYRLRDLAKHQFDGDKQLKKMALDMYIQTKIKDLYVETENIKKFAPLLLTYLFVWLLGGPAAADTLLALWGESEAAIFVADLINVFRGTETWKSLEIKMANGAYDAGLINSLVNYLQVFFGCFFNIKGFSFNYDKLRDWFENKDKDCDEDDEDCEEESEDDEEEEEEVSLETILAALFVVLSTGNITLILQFIDVEYWDYKYSEVEYENYLVDHYIREMPEFQEILKNYKGDDYEAKVQEILKGIRDTRDIFDDIYDLDESAQELNDCLGDVNLDLLQELTPPISIAVGHSFTFSGSNNYGLLKGVLHQGVDLEESSSGTKASDPVYSIYNGRVVWSTRDGTFPDKTVNGGWVAIDYDVQYKKRIGKAGEDYKIMMSKIRAFYGGLDPNSLTLTQNMTVDKGQQIGVVGSAAASETGNAPSLHFGVFDLKKSVFLNPINMFITCNKSSGGSGGGSGGSGGASCALDVHSASLSKEDFTAATLAYDNYYTNEWVNGGLYDLAEDNNLSPEFVVIRAISEGFSPSGYYENLSGYHNYWSINCYNGANLTEACSQYDSWEEGVVSLANLSIVVNSDNLFDLMSKYGYIGDYWYNPGGSGLGGCYYAEEVKARLNDSKRAAEIDEYCSSGNECYSDGSGDCHSTSQEDRDAYTQYLVDDMCEKYDRIYGSY